VLAHPFISDKRPKRLIGNPAEYDVYISYRQASDGHHAGKLYALLTAKGIKVWWDKICIQEYGSRDARFGNGSELGNSISNGFMSGLVNCKYFVPLISRNSINHPTVDEFNFSKLNPDSPGDDLLLEYRLASELKDLNLIQGVFPVLIGDQIHVPKSNSVVYGDVSTSISTNAKGHAAASNILPRVSDVSVSAVEAEIQPYLESQCLNSPLVPDRALTAVLAFITTNTCNFSNNDSSNNHSYNNSQPNTTSSNITHHNPQQHHHFQPQQFTSPPNNGKRAVLSPLQTSINSANKNSSLFSPTPNQHHNQMNSGSNVATIVGDGDVAFNRVVDSICELIKSSHNSNSHFNNNNNEVTAFKALTPECDRRMMFKSDSYVEATQSLEDACTTIADSTSLWSPVFSHIHHNNNRENSSSNVSNANNMYSNINNSSSSSSSPPHSEPNRKLSLQKAMLLDKDVTIVQLEKENAKLKEDLVALQSAMHSTRTQTNTTDSNTMTDSEMYYNNKAEMYKELSSSEIVTQIDSNLKIEFNLMKTELESVTLRNQSLKSKISQVKEEVDALERDKLALQQENTLMKEEIVKLKQQLLTKAACQNGMKQ